MSARGADVSELTAFRPVRAPRAFEEIAAQIRRELAAGRLKAGARLPPERDLAQAFGVSRNTLREALRSLENAGLLQFRKGASGGAYVRESTAEAVLTGMRDMYSLGAIRPEHLTEARIWIESAAIRAACERATAADLEALTQNVAAAAAAGAVDFYRSAAIHLEFHRLIARATGNPVMMLTMDAILEVMQQFLDTIGPTENPYVLPSRRRFLRHMAERDAEAAVAEMEKHLKRLHRHYLSLAGGRAEAA
ncbi:MAG: FadR family transcriptional regulator [Burkholderiales bacterium]|nr:FadR family transcriptional regulator [Burkholderiales bacterium]